MIWSKQCSFPGHLQNGTLQQLGEKYTLAIHSCIIVIIASSYIIYGCMNLYDAMQYGCHGMTTHKYLGTVIL